MPSVRLNGIDLYHELHGDGPPLLLVAGLASDVASWLPVRDALGAQFRLVMPDNRGAGRTTPADAPISVEAMAEDCVALLDALGLERTHVLGHSMGGMIAVELASRHPDRVDRLVIAGSGAVSPRAATVLGDLADARDRGLPKPLWFRLLFPWLFRPAFFDDPAVVAEAARLSAEYWYLQGDAAFRAQLEAGRSYAGHAAAAARVRAPTLVVHGAADVLITPEDSARAFAGIPGHRRVTIPDAAHSLHWDAPEAFVREIVAFLRER